MTKTNPHDFYAAKGKKRTNITLSPETVAFSNEIAKSQNKLTQGDVFDAVFAMIKDNPDLLQRCQPYIDKVLAEKSKNAQKLGRPKKKTTDLKKALDEASAEELEEIQNILNHA